MAHIDVPETESQDRGPTHLDFRLRDILCANPPWSSVSETSVWILRLGDIRLNPPSQGHLSGTSVSGTTVWIIRLRDIRLEPPSRAHRLGLQITSTEGILIITHRAIEPNSKGSLIVTEHVKKKTKKQHEQNVNSNLASR